MVMRKLFSVLLLFVFILAANAQDAKIDGCTITCYYGNETYIFEAYGNVYVEKDPTKHVDLYVKIVNEERLADYSVYKTTDKPQDCGEWRFVTNRKDATFTIRYVKDREDIRIFFTNNRSKAGY